LSVPGYHRPATIEDAARLLEADGARCLAGGATLVAMMNAGLVEPRSIVSLGGIPGLGGIKALEGGGFVIGAMTRHRETSEDGRLDGTLAVVRSAAGQIANATVRNMGTMGGSVSFADPAADYPSALVAAAAEIEIASASGRRRVRAEAFFVDWYATALDAGELVSAIYLPPPRRGVGIYRKLARVSGDFAIASIALAIANEVGFSVRIAVGGCGPKPIHLDDVDRALSEGLDDAETVRAAGRKLAEASDPVDDVRASAEYRRLIVPRLVEQAIGQARQALETR
jgi:carbon-monoxide dehydrogenase medium subunit